MAKKKVKKKVVHRSVYPKVRNSRAKKTTKKPASKTNIDKILIENFVSLQKVLTNMTLKFDELSGNISKLLELFELSAKALAHKEINLGKPIDEKKILKELENISDQNKTIARGITLMHDKVHEEPLEVEIPKPSPMKKPSASPGNYQNHLFLKDFKMLENSPEDFKTIFLLKFTEKLIQNTSPTIFLKAQEKKIKQQVQETIQEEPLKQVSSKPNKIQIKTRGFSRQPRRVLRVPETRLPPQFSYLKPTATKPAEIDLGKLNPFIKDPGIREIEIHAPEEYAIVKGTMGEKPINLKLTKEEIDKVIQGFSNKSKIPVGQGATKIVLGDLILSTMIEDKDEPRFIIKKIPKPPPNAKRQDYGAMIL